MKIGCQLKFTICNIIVSILMLILGLTNKIECLDSGLSFMLDFLFSVVFVLLDHKSKLVSVARDYYLCITYAIAQILEIEMLIDTKSKGIFIFVFLRLFALFQVVSPSVVQKLLYFIIVIYSIIRFNEYENAIAYIGFVYTPLIFPKSNETNHHLLQLLSEIIPNSLLIIDKVTHKPLYHTKALEKEFKYDLNHADEFVECLDHFQSNEKTQLKAFMKETRTFLQQPHSAFKNLLTEIMDNCEYFASSPLFQKFTGPHEGYDEEGDHRQGKFSAYLHHEIMIESPKNQFPSKPSIHLSEETPNNQRSHISEELLVKNLSQRSICITELKKKKLKIHLSQCFWNKRQAFALVLLNKETDGIIKTLHEQITYLEQVSSNKDVILATVFHDFKTPINGIVAILESLEGRDDINSVGKYHLKIIRKNVSLMLYMIHDILDYARIQKNQLRLCVSDFFLNEVIDEVIETIAIQSEQKGVEIKTHYDIPSFQIHSDPNRIKQIVMNILSNSLKFTEKGSITINVQSLNSDKNTHIIRSNSSKNIFTNIAQQSVSQIRKALIGKGPPISSTRLIYTISIEDTGCGISDEIKPQLFNMFATFSTQKIENKSGTGIGLMVCKKLVNLLGPSDNIELQSKPNVGTKMTFHIYARLQDDPKGSSNYISCFRQEDSSQHFEKNKINQSEESPNAKDRKQPKFVRSSQLRIYTKPIEKTETEEPSLEDEDLAKHKNIIKLQSFGQKTYNNKIPQKDDSQEVLDPKYKIQQVLQNKKFGVLIVDDQPFNVLAFKLLLQDIVPQLDIIEAYNGQQAINKIVQFQQTKNIRYVFIDLYMPILNGWQTIENIKKMINNGEIESLKIIALSGFDDDSEQDKCGKVGFDAFIPKPIKLEMIAEVFSLFEKEL